MRPRNPTPVSRGYRMKLQTSVHPRSHKTVTDLAAAFGCPQSLVVDLALGVLEIVLSRPDGEVMLTPREYVDRYLRENCVLGSVDDNPLFQDYQALKQG